MTDRELACPHDTSNLFDLPMFCQYGIGGPGLGAWRELAANLIVTEAVLAGQTPSFPLLYHWRLLPGHPPVAAEHSDIDAVVARLGNSTAVHARWEDLAAAAWSLVLFFEYIPYSVLEWLRDDPVGRADTLERQLSEIVAILRDRELLHMDGHFGNIRTDGKQVYLTDFGLATSPRFDLSAVERDFVEHHATHDARYASRCLVNWLVTVVSDLPIVDTEGLMARDEYVRRCAAGHLPDTVPPALAAILARHASAAATMNRFCWTLFGGDVRAEYPGTQL